MQRDFDNNDFEQFVKQNADQYRMYPSEKVWNGIHASIHTRRTWYSVGFIFLMLAVAVVTWMMVSSPHVKQAPRNTTNAPAAAIENLPVTDKKSDIPEFIGSVSSTQVHKFPEPVTDKKGLFNDKPLPILEEIADQIISQKTMAEPVTRDGHIVFSDTKDVAATDIESPIPFSENYFIVDQATDDEYDLSQIKKNSTNTIQQSVTQREIYPLTIESVVNSYKSSSKHRKISWQLAITPTISYRRLSENKSYLRNVSFANSNYSYAYVYNVNSVVTHKPDMGFQLGLNAGYHLTKNMMVRAGMQFNINRYGIKAFSYSNEVATIALNSNRGKDSLNEISQYRNFNGYRSNWLQNLYYSISAPIGIELNLAGNNKTQFGIAGTIQPTYIISDKAYLISTDYKNYVEVPWLVRRWNMNTGLEMFVNYSTKNTTWQVGPQVRYQLLSSFQNKYPVSENLFDFGLKIGVTLNK